MHDLLGYRNFLEGRITSLKKHAGHWCKGLIQRLLQITHRQWTYRNRTIHYKDQDGLTAAQQEKIAKECEEFLWTDPMSLLPEDRDLLDIDFDELGEAHVEDRYVWLSEMKTAKAASSNANRFARLACVGWLATSRPSDVSSNVESEVPIDTEGSLRFRWRKKKASG
jgi:hypothetical protein